VGLTGGLASGKSTVAALIGERGVPRLDADAVVHDLYRPGGEGARAAARLFGADLLDADGAVDRHRLGQRVLEAPADLDRLNAVIHPLVRGRVDAWLADLGSGATVPGVAVIEAALLVETGAWRRYDLLVVVWCRPEQQLARAARRGVAADRARALIAAQSTMAEKRALAHVTIDNSGDRAQLVREVDRAWREIEARCAQRRRAGRDQE
jgi:dephospho-CoA kinase